MDRTKKMPELLVPAGSLKTLKYAVEYGADAVYIGGKKFNLRSLGNNFSIDELEEAVNYCHDKNVKIYITLNSIVFENEIPFIRPLSENSTLYNNQPSF